MARRRGGVLQHGLQQVGARGHHGLGNQPQQPDEGIRAASAADAGAAAYSQRFASLCAACHGANGRSEIPGTPSLAGQHGFYAITQLFLFREGRRSNEAMTAVAKTMKDDDLRGFAAVIEHCLRCRRRRRDAGRPGADEPRRASSRASTSACSATATT